MTLKYKQLHSTFFVYIERSAIFWEVATLEGETQNNTLW